MKESTAQAIQGLTEFYYGRVAQVDALRTMNHLFGGSAVLLALATDNPALWVGLGVAVVDATINAIRLRKTTANITAEYRKVKGDIILATSSGK